MTETSGAVGIEHDGSTRSRRGSSPSGRWWSSRTASRTGTRSGSSLALVRALNIAAGGSAAGFSGVASRAEAWYAGPMPGWWKAVALDTKCRHFDEHNHPPSAATEPTRW
jgi:hypothetical protein